MWPALLAVVLLSPLPAEIGQPIKVQETHLGCDPTPGGWQWTVDTPPGYTAYPVIPPGPDHIFVVTCLEPPECGPAEIEVSVRNVPGCLGATSTPRRLTVQPAQTEAPDRGRSAGGGE